MCHDRQRAPHPAERDAMLIALIDLYSLVVLASVILSWVRPDPDNAIVRVIHQLTEPVLSRVRQIVPAAGGLDFSAMVVLIGLQLLKRLLLRL
jgi:YggT family protein